jgi:hypothetical protein
MGNGGVGLPYVGSASGSFAPFVAVNDPVSIVKPWSFVSGPISAFWTVDGFTFDLTSSSIFAQGGSPATVSVTGSGTISGNGFTATTGTWAFSTQDPSAQALFTFSAAAGGQGLPDGGTTAILLGAALSALGLLRRKLA